MHFLFGLGMELLVLPGTGNGKSFTWIVTLDCRSQVSWQTNWSVVHVHMSVASFLASFPGCFSYSLGTRLMGTGPPPVLFGWGLGTKLLRSLLPVPAPKLDRTPARPGNVHKPCMMITGHTLEVSQAGTSCLTNFSTHLLKTFDHQKCIQNFTNSLHYCT